MEEFKNMTHSEMLTMLLDGELDGTHEAALYAQIAIDPDLQNELREHLAIRESVKEDRKALIPPLEATSGVFQRLGFSTASQIVPKVGATLGVGAAALLISKFWKPAVIIIAGGLATSYFANKIEEVTHPVAENIPIVKAIEAEEIKPAKAEIKNEIKPDTKPVKKYSGIAVRTFKNNNNINNLVDNKENKTINNQVIELQQQEVEYISKTQQEEPSAQIPLLDGLGKIIINPFELPKYNKSKLNNTGPIAPSEYGYYFNNLGKDKNNLTIIINGSYPFSKSEANLLKSKNQRLGGYELQFLFIKTQYGNVGIDIGSETFANVTFSDINNLPYNDQATPFLIGATFRHEMNYIEFLGFTPFIQPCVGNAGSVGGFYLKGIGGIETDNGLLYGIASFSVGVSDCYLFYKRDSGWLSSNKFGIFAGLKFKF